MGQRDMRASAAMLRRIVKPGRRTVDFTSGRGAVADLGGPPEIPDRESTVRDAED